MRHLSFLRLARRPLSVAAFYLASSGFACARGAPARQTPSLCLGPDAVAEEFVRRAGRYLTTADTSNVAGEAVTAGIELVTDPTLCARAAAAHARTVRTDRRVVPVYLVRIGSTRYMIVDEETRAGEFRPYGFYDAAFQFIGGVAN